VTLIADGLHPVLHRDRYDAIERVNFSTLKAFAKSPKRYRHGLITPPEDTDPKKLGRVVHIAAFEPERFRNAIAVWDGGTRRGKDWDRFKASNEGRELLTVNEYEKCMAIQAAVRADATAMNYLQNGRGEVSLLWTANANETGEEIACKGRIDFDSQTALVDLKTTKDVTREGFGRQVVTLDYHSQFAWYSDGYFKSAGIRKPYVIVAVENEAPHDVVVYRVPEIALRLGRERYDRWLDQLAFCRAHNTWPGYSGGVELELELPKWALPADDDDPTGFGLEVSEG
jgi:hypothetical protein